MHIPGRQPHDHILGRLSRAAYHNIPHTWAAAPPCSHVELLALLFPAQQLGKVPKGKGGGHDLKGDTHPPEPPNNSIGVWMDMDAQAMTVQLCNFPHVSNSLRLIPLPNCCIILHSVYVY